jgi:hemerythrin-like domain-containing protein
MSVRIGQAPESDFTDPLGLLSDCHRRIERFLALLIEVTGQSRGAELKGERREAFETALRYFREAAPKHTLDEEESLFPRMRASGAVSARAALARLDSLHADHLAAEARHREADALGRRWLAQGRLPDGDAARMARLLEELRATYQTHIRAEDEEVFPLAGEILSGEEIEAVGREMAARRGVRL